MAVLVPTFELAEKIGKQVEIDADTVGDLLDQAIARYGEEFRQAIRSSTIVVNGRAIGLLQRTKTRLKKEDVVWMLKPAGGG
jgi:molybdopterin converting factor small subunit